MDPLSFLNVQFIMFSLGIATIVFIFRTIIEFITKELHREVAVIWSNLILPIFPIIIGSVIAFFFKTYPFPDGLTDNLGRIFFGSVGGLISGLLYQIIKGLLQSKVSSTMAPYLPSTAAPYTPPTPPPAYIPPQNQVLGGPGSKSA